MVSNYLLLVCIVRINIVFVLVEDMDLRQINRVRVMDQDLRQPPMQIPISQPPIQAEPTLPLPLP